MELRARLGRFFQAMGRRLNPDGARGGDGPPNEADLLRTVLDAVNQAIWVDSLDRSHSLLSVGNYENLYGRPMANLATDPMDFLNAVHPEDRARVEAALDRRKTYEFDIQYRVVHGNGTVKWLRDQAFLIRDAQGAPRFQSGIVTDVTAQIELEEQVRHDQKIKAVGALAGGICHDFNNVLAVIQGNLELTLAEAIPDSAAENLNAALGACRRGATLTHRLLAYSRKQPLSPRSVDPASIVNDLENILKRSLTEAVELEIVSGAGLWTCHADRNELETVVLNLAINAQQAMPDNGKLTVEVFNARIDDEYARAHDDVTPGQYVCFAVTDNGTGMPPQVVARAFDPFFTTKEAGAGSGLGLSMAYGFAKQSRGHIKIYSEPGKGTTVKLYLPRSTENGMPRAERASQLSADGLVGLSVLVVENDDAVRRAVAAQVRGFGCRTVSAASADDALAIVAAGETFDLLLFDVILGGDMTGPDLARVIETEIPGIRVLFMSGFTENAIIHDGKLDPGVQLIQKPFTRPQLLSAILRAADPPE